MISNDSHPKFSGELLKYHFDDLEETSTWLFVSPLMEQLPIFVEEIGEFYYTGRQYTERSNRKTYQIGCILDSGDAIAKITFRGSSYEVTTNSVFWVDCDEGYITESSGNGLQHSMFLHFSGNDTKQMFETFYKQNGESPIIYNYADTIEPIIKRLISIYEQSPVISTDILAMQLVIDIISQLIYYVSPPTLKEYRNPHIVEAIEIINNSPDLNIKLSDLSQRFDMSEFYFSRLFKRTIGVSFRDYIASKKMVKIKSLLTSTDKSLDEISSELHMNDKSYLIRFFSAHEGITPIQFKKQFINRKK